MTRGGDNSRFGAKPEPCHALKHVAGTELSPVLCTVPMTMVAGTGCRQGRCPQKLAGRQQAGQMSPDAGREAPGETVSPRTAEPV